MIDYSNWDYRQSVSAFILNKNDQLLLISPVRVVNYSWNIPGGGLEAGETHEQAVFREIKEELLIDFKYLEILYKSDVINKYEYPEEHILKRFESTGQKYKGQERIQFVMRFISDDFSLIKLDLSEVSSFKWVSLNDLPQYFNLENMRENAQNVLSKFIND